MIVFAILLVLLRIFYSLAEMYFEHDWPRRTFRGLVVSIALLFMCCSAFGQASRWDWNAQTVNQSSTTSQGFLPILAIPNAQVNICNAPAVGTPCINAATTYVNAAQTTTCPSTAQLTRPNSAICVATADQQGAYGAWLAPGTYQYTVTVPWGTAGPFDLTIGAAAPLKGTTASLGGGALTANTCSTATATLTGVTTSQVIVVTPVADPNGTGAFTYWWYGKVTAPNTVTVSLCALTSGTPTATTYNVRAIP